MPSSARLMAQHKFARRVSTERFLQTSQVKGMSLFKCPYCQTGYEMLTARLSFQQRSYAKCQVCQKTMYSWNARNVPIFTLVPINDSEGASKAPNTTQRVRTID
jgi:hypothetical protein